jgi:hypothetical protein
MIEKRAGSNRWNYRQERHRLQLQIKLKLYLLDSEVAVDHISLVNAHHLFDSNKYSDNPSPLVGEGWGEGLLFPCLSGALATP